MSDTSNRKISTTALDFDAIKSNIKTYLQGQDTFKDYDFEGSSLSVLLDVLAYNTHYNALYTNLAVNESFLDSASKRSSVVSRAKEIGYVPHSAKSAIATVNITVANTTSTPSTLTIPANQQFNSTIDRTTYTFYNRDAITASLVNSQYVFENVELTEGTLLEFRYEAAAGVKYTIPNLNVDLSTLTVTVQENSTSSAFDTFINQEDIINLNSQSKVYFVKEIEGELYEIEFGNDVIGKAVSNGNIVTLRYMTTNKEDGNGARVFSYQGSTLLGGSIAITTVNPSTGGTDIEQIDSVRYNAPRSYSAQNRAVTTEDYKALLFRLFPQANSINIWGGEDNIPAIYGKVFISIQPSEREFLTAFEKQNIVEVLLKERNVVSITPEIVDPQYINIQADVSVYYNPRLTTLQPYQIKNEVLATITDFNDNNLNSFTGSLRYSKLVSAIDATEPSITANITTLKMHREIEVAYNQNYTYAINLGNPIYHSGVPEQSILSTGFYIAGNENIMYIEDLPTPSNLTGILRLYYIENNNKVYVRNFGTIDYATGQIILSELHITGIIQGLHTSTLELIIKPQSNDIISIRNQIVRITPQTININVITDKLAMGDSAGGASHIFSSSRN